MKPCERTDETVVGVIAVFQGNINNLFITAAKLLRRKSKPSVADIFAHRKTAQHPENTLKMEWRNVRFRRYILDFQFLREIVLDIGYRRLNALCPTVHSSRSFPLV